LGGNVRPSDPASPPSSVPTARRIGLFLTNVNVRVFNMDFIAGTVQGPAGDVLR
jgi:hypothetical protein